MNFKRLIPFALLCVLALHAQKRPLVQPVWYFPDQSGNACAGCKLTSYLAGTTTPTPTYTDSTGTHVNTNPITLGVNGTAQIWVGDTPTIKLILKDTLGATIWTADNIALTATGGAGCSVAGTAGQFIVTNGSGACTVTAIQVNGVSLLTPSPLNFVDSATVHPHNDAAGNVAFDASNTLAVQVEDSATGVNQNTIDFNSTDPHPPAGFTNVIWQNDFGTGRKSAYVPNANPNITSFVSIPAGNYSVIYPHRFAITRQDFAPPSIVGSADGRNGSGTITMGSICSLSYTDTGTWDQYSLADVGLTPADVIDVQAFAIQGVSAVDTNNFCFPSLAPATYALATMSSGTASIDPPHFQPSLIQQYGPTPTGFTGAQVATATTVASMTIGAATRLNTTSSLPSVGLIIHSSIPAPIAPNRLYVRPPLVFDLTTQSIYLDPLFPQALNSYSITAPPNPGLSYGKGVILTGTLDCVTASSDLDQQWCKPLNTGGGSWVWAPFGGSGSGGINQLTGDVTAGPGTGSQVATIAPSAVTTTKINNAAVTLAKIQNAAASSKLLGSGASGSGAAYSEITLGTNLSMSGTTLNATGGGGGGTIPNTTFMLQGDGAGNALATAMDDGHTTAATITSTEPIAVAVAGGVAGAVGITQGTAAANNTTAVTLTVPSSVTSYRVQFPGVHPSGSNTFLSCTSADPAVCSWAAGGSSGDALISRVSCVTYGCVADGNKAANTGTDNTTPFTNCLAAAVAAKGLCYIPAGQYRIATVMPTISTSGTGFVGDIQGFTVISGGSTPEWIAPATTIFTSSVSASPLESIASGGSWYIFGDHFENIGLESAVTRNANTIALSLNKADTAIVKGNVFADSPIGIDLTDSPSAAGPVGSISGNGTLWGYGDLCPAGGTFTGYFLHGGTVGFQTTLLDSNLAADSCTAASRGFVTDGANINDLKINLPIVINAGNGVTIASTGGTASDIQVTNGLFDSIRSSDFACTGLTQSNAATLLYQGNWSHSNGGNYAVDLGNCQGVQVLGNQIEPQGGGAGTAAIRIAGGAGNTIVGNYVNTATLSTGGALLLDAAGQNTIDGNTFWGNGSTSIISLINSSTWNAFGVNKLMGGATNGISATSGSNNNCCFNFSNITNTGGITTPINDAGTSNSFSAAVAWGAITGTLSSQTDLNTALGLKAPLASPAFTGTPDASGATQFKLPVAASGASAANGEVIYDSTNKNWHLWKNGADSLLIPFPISPTSGDCYAPTLASGVWSMVDAGGPCGVSGGGSAFSAITSGSNTTATMTVGSGGTLTVGGTGVNNANQVNGATVPASQTALATNSSGQIIAGSAGGLVMLESHTASASASLSFTTCISGTYDEYEFHFIGVVPGTTNQTLQMLMSTDGGSTYLGGSNYNYLLLYSGIGDTWTQNTGSGVADIDITHSTATTTSYTTNGQVTLYNPATTSGFKFILGRTQSVAGGNMYQWNSTGVGLTTTAVNAIQFKFASGTVASGTIRCYGVSH